MRQITPASTISLAGLFVLVAVSETSAAQFARPNGTVSGGSWSAQGAATLHEATDEVAPNDATDYMLADSVDTTAELSLDALTDPQSSTGHVIRFRMTTTGGGAKEECEVQLYQGGSLIATTGAQRATIRGNYETFTYTLAAGEADSITDYSSLRLRIGSANVKSSETVHVTWAELEVPDPPGAGVPVLSAPAATNVDTTSATLGATIDSDGGDPITERGTVWNTTGSPIVENPLVEGGTALGSFSHSRSGLPSGALVYFRGYAANSIGTGYSPDATFYTEPTQASSVGFLNVQSTTMRITWSAGGGDGAIVVVRAGTPVDAAPVDGTEHVASSTFGSGDELGTGNFVVFRGAATLVDVSGLSADTTYYVAVYESAGSGTGTSGINYQQDLPATGSQTTGTASAPSGHNADHNIQCNQCHALHGSSTVPRDGAQETVCKTCHNESGAAAAKSDVGLHVVSGGAVTIDCGSCHEVHNGYDFSTTDTHPAGVTADNISRIRWDVTKYVPGALEPALFQQRPLHFAFGASNAPYNGICQTCHQNTKNHTNDGFDDDDGVPANNDHELGNNCTSCHDHTGGFAPSGGGCTTCHGSAQDNLDGGPTRRAIVGEFSLTSHHVVGGAVTDDDCGVCHYEAVDAGYHKNNAVDLRDPDLGTPIASFAQFSRDTNTDALEAWVTNVQNNFCLKCHDVDGATATFVSGASALRPFSSNSRDVPDVYDRFATSNSFHHAVRGPAANPYCVPSTSNGNNITMEPPWNQDGTHDVISCFDCHAAGGHGGGNQRMLRVAIDLDAMETGTLSTTIGNQVEIFCSLCHKASVYVSGTDPEALGSIYEYHPGSQGQHGSAGGNELGCMGCHGGIVDYGPPGPNNGASRGNLHGGIFTWPAGTFSSGTQTQHFMLGGWIGGWLDGGSQGECAGGDCNHTGSSTRSGKTYTR